MAAPAWQTQQPLRARRRPRCLLQLLYGCAMVFYLIFVAGSVFLAVQDFYDSRFLWFVIAIALVALQHYATAWQLVRAQLGWSMSLPACPLVGHRPYQSKSACVRQLRFFGEILLAVLLVPFVPLLDFLAVVTLLLNWRCSGAPPIDPSSQLEAQLVDLEAVAVAESQGSSRLLDGSVRSSTEDPALHAPGSPTSPIPPPALHPISMKAWAPHYACQRLGMAGLLQAAPQLFLHVYITIYCHWHHYCGDNCPDQKPRLLLLWIAMGLDVALLVVAQQGMKDVVGLVGDWMSWSTSGALLREFLELALVAGDIGTSVLIYLAWRKSHHWWMRWLPLGALALQFPASCLILLWWNSTPCTPKLGAHARSCGVMGILQWLVAATFLLPVGIPLLDVVAVCLLVKSGIQAVDRVPKGPLGWLLFGTMEWLRWLAVPAANLVYCCVMRPLRALCSARDLPSVAALLNGPFQYREAVDVVWAENYKFARVPLHALLGSLPLAVMQLSIFFLGPRQHQPSLMLLTISVALSVGSCLVGLSMIRNAASLIGWSFWRVCALAFQLQGACRPPASILRKTFHEGDPQSQHVVLDLAKQPVTVVQKAGLLRGRMAAQASLSPTATSGWVMEVRNLKAEKMLLKHHRGALEAKPLLDSVLHDARFQLAGLQEVALTDCDLDDRLVQSTAETLDTIQSIHGTDVALTVGDQSARAEAQLSRLCEAGPPNTIYSSAIGSPNVTSTSLKQPAAVGTILSGGGSGKTPPGSLNMLVLDRCEGLYLLPESIGSMQQLQLLCINKSPLQVLPHAIYALTQLEVLQLPQCSSLQRLPDALGDLALLRILDCSGCSSLQALPPSIGTLRHLQLITLVDCTSLRALPPGIARLPALRGLLLANCPALAPPPFLPAMARFLEVLDLSFCSRGMHQLLAQLELPAALRKLTVHGCALEALPDRVAALDQLLVLDLSYSDVLLRLPDRLPARLEELTLLYCDRLRALPVGLAQAQGLRRVDLRDTDCLNGRPEYVAQLRARGVQVQV